MRSQEAELSEHEILKAIIQLDHVLAMTALDAAGGDVDRAVSILETAADTVRAMVAGTLPDLGDLAPGRANLN